MVVLQCHRVRNYHSNGGYSDERVTTVMRNDEIIVLLSNVCMTKLIISMMITTSLSIQSPTDLC